jgi:hypothetical protein
MSTDPSLETDSTASAGPPTPPSPERDGPARRDAIPIRRPRFDFGAEIPKHWAGGNPFATHMFNATNLLFPQGERFFIRAVNDCLPDIEDPELRRQARAFAGQEAVHGQAHEAYFETLRRQGYRIDGSLRAFQWIHDFMSLFPRSLRLAITAGAEHYTATLGHFALTAQHARTFHPTMERLVVWHATEEVEHKAVAFDVLQGCGIGYVKRIVGFLIASLFIGGYAAVVGRRLMRQDGLSRSEIRAARDALLAKHQRDDPAAVAFLSRQLRSYFRRDFHPDDVDDLEIAHARLAELGLDGLAA